MRGDNMKLITSYGFENVRYVFLKDKKFTLLWAHTEGSTQKNMFGMSFCSPDDTYDELIGCLKALKRMCNNLKLERKERAKLFDAFLKAYTYAD